MRGEPLICSIDEQIVYNQLKGNEAAIWSLLVASGYLKVVRRECYEEPVDVIKDDAIIIEFKVFNSKKNSLWKTPSLLPLLRLKRNNTKQT